MYIYIYIYIFLYIYIYIYIYIDIYIRLESVKNSKKYFADLNRITNTFYRNNIKFMF